LTCRLHSLALALVLCASPAVAYTNGWYGWPCPTNVSYYGVETNHYFYQLYTALVERCVAVGVAGPVCVDTNTVYDGFTNNIVTTNGLTVTNPVIQYRTIIVTNTFLPFEYSWSNTFGSGVSTCYPPVRRSWFVNWDAKLFAIVASFIDDTKMTNGDFNVYLSTLPAFTLPTFPRQSSTQLFERASIGWSDRSVAHWTHSCITSNSDWLLASIHSGGTNPSAWTFKRWTDLTNMHPENALYAPIAQYVSLTNAGPTVASNLTLTLYGTCWGSAGTNVITTNEVTTFLSTNPVSLKLSWRTVTNVLCSSERPFSNDAVRVTYQTLPPLYDASIGWRLTPESLNERRAVMSLLQWSYAGLATCDTVASPINGAWYSASSAVWTNTVAWAQASAESRYALDTSYPMSHPLGPTHGYPWVGSTVRDRKGSPNYASWVAGMRFGKWKSFTSAASNEQKQAQLYVMGTHFSGEFGSPNNSTSMVAQFDTFGNTNILYGTYRMVGATIITTNWSDAPEWEINATNLSAISSNWAGTPTGVTQYWTRGWYMYEDRGRVIYCHTNWYRFK
jgi:hypothetical protein